jgi:hypothetical protein
MGQITKCNICGKIYNESYLTAHKRRSHAKQEALPGAAQNGRASVEAIVSLFAGLSADQKKELLDRLAAADRIKL